MTDCFQGARKRASGDQSWARASPKGLWVSSLPMSASLTTDRTSLCRKIFSALAANGSALPSKRIDSEKESTMPSKCPMTYRTCSRHSSTSSIETSSALSAIRLEVCRAPRAAMSWYFLHTYGHLATSTCTPTFKTVPCIGFATCSTTPTSERSWIAKAWRRYFTLSSRKVQSGF